MANVTKIMGTVTKFLKNSEGLGTKFHMKIDKRMFVKAAEDTKNSVVIKKFSELKNPSIDITCKSKGDKYVIGIATMKEGDKPIMSAAASISHPGTDKALLKMRASNESGHARAFFDKSKSVNLIDDDFVVNLSRKNGITKTEVTFGEVLAINSEATQKKAFELYEKFGITEPKEMLNGLQLELPKLLKELPL